MIVYSVKFRASFLLTYCLYIFNSQISGKSPEIVLIKSNSFHNYSTLNIPLSWSNKKMAGKEESYI
uniref:Uncharacterized protein n=1 Tax=Lepeophtheirus salmonis TaxID=72036 RepID=A0A0K2T173_LEPSM